MNPSRLVLVAILAANLGACSTIIEGTSQTIAVNSVPTEARCELKRDGAIIGVVPSTPGTVSVEKNKQNILISCTKAGYKEGTYNNKSDFAGATAGNLLVGGIIGIGIDAATGAANKYESDVTIRLEQVDPPQFPPPKTPENLGPTSKNAGKPTS